MKKKFLIFSSLIASSLVVAMLIGTRQQLVQPGYANQDYTITLNSADDVDIVNKKATHTDRATTFAYKNVTDSDDGHIIINRNGYIKNTSPIVGCTTLKVAYQLVSPNDLNEQNLYGFGNLFVVFDTHPIDNPFSYSQDLVIEQSAEGNVVSVPSGTKYFALASYNTCDIKNIDITYRCGDDGYVEDNSNFTLNIVGTNDIHGQTLKNDDASAGLTNASKKINDLKTQYKYNLLLDQGDLYQGSIDSYSTNGRVMDEYLLVNGYDSTLIGNHEWDYSFAGKNDNGIEDHLAYLKDTHVSILGNNILYKGNEVDWNITMEDKNGNDLRGCKIVERHGVKIGIIGMAGDYASSISADLIIDYSFAGARQQLKTRTINASNALRELGADLIILQVHDGSSGNLMDAYDLELSSGGYVDLVLESHTHNGYDYIDSYGVHHVQARGYLESMYNITVDFTYDQNTDSWNFNVNNASFYQGYSLVNNGEDEKMNDIYYWYSNRVFGYNKNRVLAANAPYIGNNDMRLFTATSIYEACEEEFGDTYDIIYGGGYCNLRGQQQVNAGKVTFGDINNLLPFDNDIQVCSGLFGEFKNLFLGNAKYVNYLPSKVTIENGVYKNNGVEIKDSDRIYFATDSYNTQYWIYGDGVGNFPSYRVEANYTAIHNKFVRHIVADKFNKTYIDVNDIPGKVNINSTDLEVEINKTMALQTSVDKGNNSLFFTTSNENIATVNGLTGLIRGKNLGKCTITATSLLDSSIYASVEIEVVEEKEVIVNYGTRENPLSVSEAIELYNLECSVANAVSNQPIYVEGYVNGAPESIYDNYVSKFYIAESATENSVENSLYVYSASYGGEYGTSAPNYGDHVVLYGYLKNYNGTRELASNAGQYVWVVDQNKALSPITVNIAEGTTINVISGAAEGSTDTIASSLPNGSTISFTIVETTLPGNLVFANGEQIAPKNDVYSIVVNGPMVISINVTVGEGTLDKPYSPAEVIQLASFLENGYMYTDAVYVSGQISRIQYTPNAQYPTYRVYLTDSSGNEIIVPHLYDVGGADFPVDDNSLTVGQVIIVYGNIFNNNYYSPNYGVTQASIVR